MHGHYLLKLTASLARVRKTLLYSIIFVRMFCTLFNGYYICIWPRSVVHLSWLKLSYLNYLKNLTIHSVLNFSVSK